MFESRLQMERRAFLAAIAGFGMVAPLGSVAHAQLFAAALAKPLDLATDHALDRLAQPGAFYNDTAIRIGIPGIGGDSGMLGGLMGAVSGLTGLDGITHKLNDVAGMAAHSAKPVFHAAIAHLRLTNVPDIVKERDGGTQYLRRSAGDELHRQVRPLIDSAMAAIGVYGELDRLSGHGGILASLGLSHDSLGNSVTGQALNGIYRYMAEEEGKLRANPLGAVGGLGTAINGLKF
jgi:hypothetical protein